MQVEAYAGGVTVSQAIHQWMFVPMRLIRCATLIMPVDAAPAVNDGNWKELVLESSVPVIVDFWAPWCGPCRMIAPLIDELAVEYGDKIKAVSSIPQVQPRLSTRAFLPPKPVLLFLWCSHARRCTLSWT